MESAPEIPDEPLVAYRWWYQPSPKGFGFDSPWQEWAKRTNYPEPNGTLPQSYVHDQARADLVLAYYGDRMVPLKGVRAYPVIYDDVWEGRVLEAWNYWVLTNESFTGEGVEEWLQWHLPAPWGDPPPRIETYGWQGWKGGWWVHRSLSCGDAPWDAWAQETPYQYHGNSSNHRYTSNESQANLILDYYASRGAFVAETRAYPLLEDETGQSLQPCVFLSWLKALDTFEGYRDGWLPWWGEPGWNNTL